MSHSQGLHRVSHPHPSASASLLHKPTLTFCSTTSSNNSKFSVDSNSSKDTANTEDTEYSQSSIVNTKNKRSQIKTPEQCDESGSSRDINSSIQDESPTAYRCFPTFRLIRGTFPTAPSSPTPSDPASDSDVDDYSSVIHHSDDDYASDDDDDNESTTDPDSLDDLDIVHTIDRPEYGLQYVLLTNSKWYIYHDRRKISRMLPDEHEDFLAWMNDPDTKPASTITD